jgi:cytochrome c
VQLTGEDLVNGIKLYETNCAICHGTTEEDTSASPVAKGENPNPPQLATDAVEDDPEGETFWKIKHGIRWTGMPAWKDELSDQQIWTLALFLKTWTSFLPVQKPHGVVSKFRKRPQIRSSLLSQKADIIQPATFPADTRQTRWHLRPLIGPIGCHLIVRLANERVIAPPSDGHEVSIPE